MRNLKRALSLALAAVMVLGMMVIGAGAADAYDNFTDKDEIVNKEAVNTMVSLGVIAGKEDGSYFDPTGIVTRAEMAKIVAVSLNGGKDPVMGADAKTTFSDTQGHWAELYIAYCVQQNIIAGMGGNRFGPDLPVTGSAAAKMFLCALGYRADLEGLTGSNWEINTNVKANQDAGLYEGLSAINASDGLSRDNTAQMLYNAVQAQEVKYDNLYGEYTGVLQTIEQGTMLWNRFKVRKVTGILEANDKLSVAGAISTTSGGTTTVLGHNFGATARENESLLYVTDVSGYTRDSYTSLYGAATYKIDTTDEMVGQEIVIYVKYLNDLSPNAANSTVVGQPILTDNNTVVETTTRLKDAAAVRTALRDGGLSNIGTPAAFLYTENDVANGVNTGITDEITELVRDAANMSRSAGIFQRFVDNNGDGYPNYIVQIVPVLSSVNSVSSSNDTFTFTGITGSIPDADIVTELELARNDVILINQYADGKYYIDAPETVEGAVASYNTNNNTVSVDGTSYGNSGGKMLSVSGAQQILTQDMVDNTYIFYLDPYGNVLGALETDTVVGNYAVVTGYDVSGNDRMGYTGKVKLILQDGTTGTYDVNMAATAVRFGLAANTASTLAKEIALVHDNTLAKNDAGYFDINPSAGGTKGQNMVDHVFSYTIDNGVVTLARPYYVNSRYTSSLSDDLDNGNLTGNSVHRNTASYQITLGSGTANIVANAQTVIFVKDRDSKYYAISGLANLPTDGVDIGTVGTVTAKDTISYMAPGSSTRMARAIFVTTSDPFKSSREFVFVTNKYTHSTSSSTPIYTFDVVRADGTTEKMSTTQANMNSMQNTVREYFVDGTYFEFEAPVTGSNEYTVDKVYVKSISGNTAILHDVKTDAYKGSFRIDGAAKIWDVQDDKPAADTLSENDVVAIKLDLDNTGLMSNGVIEAAFIYDVMNGAFAPAPAPANVTIGGAAPGETLTTTAGGKTVSVNVGSADVRLESLEVNGNEVAMTRGTGNVYTGTYNVADNTPLSVTLTVSQRGMDDFTTTYSNISVTITAGGGGGNGDRLDPAAASVNDINTALQSADVTDVTVTGDFTPSLFADTGVLNIPAGKTLTIAGDFKGNANIINRGTLKVEGTYTPAAAHNTFTGTIEAENLTLGAATAVNGTLKVHNADGDGAVTGAFALTVASSGTLNVDAGIANALTTSGTTVVGGTVGGALTVSGGTATTGAVTGAVTVSGGAATIASAASTVAVSAGALTVTGDIASAVTLTGGALTANGTTGAITATSGNPDLTLGGTTVTSLNMTGTGSLTITGANVTIATLTAAPASSTIAASAKLTITASAPIASLENFTGTDATSTLVLSAASSGSLTGTAAAGSAKFWLTAGTQGSAIGTADDGAVVSTGTYTWKDAYFTTSATADTVVTAWVK